MRYRLSRAAGDGVPAGGATSVRRTLVVKRAAAEPQRATVRAVAGDLPLLFAPLRAWATSRTSPANHDHWVDVLELPARGPKIADLQWLPTERSDEEILDEFASRSSG